MESSPDNLPALRAENRSRWQLLRDLLVFQLKLAADGVKDLVLVPVSLFAGIYGLLTSRDNPGHAFYSVLRAGREFDRWVGLYDADNQARALPPAPDQAAPSSESVTPVRPRLDDHLQAVEEKLRAKHAEGGALARAKGTVDRLLDEAVDRHERRQESSPPPPSDPSSGT